MIEAWRGAATARAPRARPDQRPQGLFVEHPLRPWNEHHPPNRAEAHVCCLSTSSHDGGRRSAGLGSRRVGCLGPHCKAQLTSRQGNSGIAGPGGLDQALLCPRRKAALVAPRANARDGSRDSGMRAPRLQGFQVRTCSMPSFRNQRDGAPGPNPRPDAPRAPSAPARAPRARGYAVCATLQPRLKRRQAQRGAFASARCPCPCRRFFAPPALAFEIPHAKGQGPVLGPSLNSEQVTPHAQALASDTRSGLRPPLSAQRGRGCRVGRRARARAGATWDTPRSCCARAVGGATPAGVPRPSRLGARAVGAPTSPAAGCAAPARKRSSFSNHSCALASTAKQPVGRLNKRRCGSRVENAVARQCSLRAPCIAPTGGLLRS